MSEHVTYDTRKPVDFVIVGSGSAGGIMAKELSVAGFSVVVLEQGPYRRANEFTHDEYSVLFAEELLGQSSKRDGQTFRHFESEEAVDNGFAPARYARTVGGSSVHFTANFWRFHEIDFNERSQIGGISGTNFADWPISYAELEPYYTKVDWEVGISGVEGPFDPPRSKPFPLPPMPVKSSGVIFERAAKKLGLHPQPEPHAILSKPFNGRSGCISCGHCMWFGCEVGAKSSTLASMIPLAEASGNCEIRPNSAVFRIATNSSNKVSEVLYIDAEGQQQGQKARAVVVCANGAETPRLLLMSESERHPNGLANSSGFVGRNLMFNAHTGVGATFDKPLNDYKGVQVTRMLHDFYNSDEKRGFYGGGGIDVRPLFAAHPIMYSLNGLPPDVPTWGKEFKDFVSHNFTRQLFITCSTTSLPLDRNNISLDPQSKDNLGRPALRVTYHDHEDDLAMVKFLQDRAVEIAEVSEANNYWRGPIEPATFSPHLLGTCRMGDDPESSVIDRNHRSHDVSNLFICDGSSFVSSGRGQPTQTIMALAFRAADKIIAAAEAGDI